jgi:hypothetical protein
MNTFDQCLGSNMTYHTWNAVSDVLFYIYSFSILLLLVNLLLCVKVFQAFSRLPVL